MKIRQIAFASPDNRVNSDVVAEWSGLKKEFIVSKIGVESRGFLTKDEKPIDLAIAACEKLLAGEDAPKREAIGLIVLATDQTMEHEFRRLLDLPGVAFYESRILNEAAITPATLKAMEARLTEAAEVILPGLPLDVVAFGCTSAAMMIGEEQVFARIRAARPGVACTTPITAAFAGSAASMNRPTMARGAVHITAAIASMNTPPIKSAPTPARRMPATSPPPAARPTRTVAACARPSGTMKVTDAHCSAI